MEERATRLAVSSLIPNPGTIFRASYRNGDGSWDECIYECKLVQDGAVLGELRWAPGYYIGKKGDPRVLLVSEVYFYAADELLKVLEEVKE